MPAPYQPIGRCIYCGVPEAESGPKGLSDEHIVPYCLGGKDILPKSSCASCAVVTSAIEGKCASSIFAPARAHMHWASRKRKKPTTSLAFILGSEQVEAVDVPMSEDARIVAMPELGPPIALIGGTYRDDLLLHGINVHFRPDSHEKMQALSKKKIATTIMFEPDVFARTLAKIAYSYAVAELGRENFKSELPASILGGAPFAGNFVGSLISSSSKGDRLHELSLVRYGELIAAKVRLYASYGGPTYQVVVGRS